MHPLQKIRFSKENNAYVVEASAGTGKTWTIERLFIKALLEAQNGKQPINIANILVVTFTNDATDELKQRIAGQIGITINQLIVLHKGIDTATDIFTQYLAQRQEYFLRDISILNRALQNFDQSAIYTIHGFCNKILHDYQFECKVNTEFELVANKSNIFELLAMNFLRSRIINGPLKNIDIVLANLEQMFSSMDTELTLAQRIAAKLPQDLFRIEKGQYKLKYNLNCVASLNKLSVEEMDSETIKTAKAEFLAAVIEYIAEKYPAMSNNSLSYDDLISRVADTLRNSVTLADKLYASFPVAFIDEFQDTDTLQWQIFSIIYQLNMQQKRGNVVVVGDPKQAIYRFRGADVDTYIEARGQIGNSLNLDTNFRSHPNILNFINQLFTSHIPGFLGSGINYTESKPLASVEEILPEVQEITRQALAKGVSCQFYAEEVQLVAINGATKPVREDKLLMSMTLEILALLNADPKLKGKIAILVTKNKEGSQVVEYLHRYGIKAAELKLGNIFLTTTANDLYLFLTAVADLTNRRHLINALTTRLFNLPLIEIAIDGSEINPLLQILNQEFYTYQQIWNSKGLISLIYALISKLYQRPDYSLNNRELANLWQLAELLNGSKVTNQSELLFWFKQKINNVKMRLSENIDGSDEELVRLDNDDEQIIVTTQHKSKGLEYSILFCPYFKNSSTLDGTYDFNYKRPFFSNYRYNNSYNSQMIMDKQIGEFIVNNDNTESHRLNYVALTRAKNRIYIYLKEPTKSVKTGKYNANERPDKIVELFGYVKSNAQDREHKLFNYPEFFSSTPNLAIKACLPGVCTYNRDDASDSDLDKLRLKNNNQNLGYKLSNVDQDFKVNPAFYRQSYSGLTRSDNYEHYSDNDDTDNPLATINYRFSILEDKQCSGATFGVLFHSLCENFPFSRGELLTLLHENNIDCQDTDYDQQLSEMLEEAFNYPIIGNVGIRDLRQSMHELEFNLEIKSTLSIANDVSALINQYFGENHPFSIASKALGVIEQGFLVGFIDLLFLHEGKYWILDYKTNALLDYTSNADINDTDNPLIQSMAEHHYYLQYLLYLVAVKRHLQQRLRISDATELIGGAVYFYVRGIYTEPKLLGQGIYLDDNCSAIVAKLDELFNNSRE